MIFCAPSLFSEISGEAAYARILAKALLELSPKVRILAFRDHAPDERYVPRKSFQKGAGLFLWGREPVIFSRTTLWPKALPLILRGRPVAFVLHGLEAWRRYPSLARWVFRRARAFFSVSRYTAERFLSANRLVRPWYLLPPALDPFFPGEETSGLTVKGPYLVTVARLSREAAYKGVDLVIRALAELRRDFPSLHYVVVGGGELVAEYHRLSLELGVADRVHFLGERRSVAGFLAGAEVFLLVSRGEGFGIAFLEAMYFRKPVVGASAGGIPEVVREGVNGLLVSYGDLEGLTVALRRLLTHREEAQRLGEAGFRILKEEFIYPRFRERLAGILGELGWA